MADSMDGDFHELTELARDLGKVPLTAGPFINSAIQVTATKVKKSARAKVAGGSRSWSGLPNTIDYEVKASGTQVEAEVGYNKARGGGKLGNIREFGAPGKNRAPHNDLANALEENQADFELGLDIALRDAERSAGL